MGICASKENQEERKVSLGIDRMMEDEAKKIKKEVKILLLGSGESGKSTIVKQMKILHQNGYSKEELLQFRATVHKNTIDSVVQLVVAIRKFELKFYLRENEIFAERMLVMSPDPDFRLTPEVADGIDLLWRDPTTSAAFERSSEAYILDSAPYFFENVKRFGEPDYIPTEQDVLRSRVKTTGITDTRFVMGQLQIHMFDVGGQRSERRKWIHCFENVTSIIFCVALSEYDQHLIEDENMNRMSESLSLFSSVVNSRWFLRTSIILFLNKIDLFKAKLSKVPLERYFPEYGGGADFSKAAKFLLWKFSQENRQKLNIYPHLTQATDTSNIRLVFAAVKVTILQNALKDSGIM
ncbi:G protein alpha subunit [Gonapodya prolifera JEL478]|uniref:G protein alpha subunit n=1 Tax=Gonapodya prolifera (strain JEL478) TaxID=1344416 RepID=A0A139A890_GONPJ|nr:G protein alpha subunit [Gonapodya prolifera JEL478]|eukprot:KXS12665.1 G protein alpha subunit [Gonapodya prolifera JEL478]